MEDFSSKSREERLQLACQSTIDNYPAFRRSLAEGRSNERFSSMALWGGFERLGLKYFFLDGDIINAKLCFYRCGWLDQLLISKYDEKILDYGINHLSYALLSDNMELILSYASLTHSQYPKMVAAGRSTPLYVLQCLIREDREEFERAMAIMKAKTVPKFKMEPDAQFYQALADRDRGKVEEAINELLTPKQHKSRNRHHLLISEFVSHPALGYAKLAWLKGVPVNIHSPLVPKELLPHAPLDNYERAPYYPGIPV